MQQSTEEICRIENFSISFRKDRKWYPAAEGVDISIHKGEMVGLVGESGCGKSVTALSLTGLEPENTIIGGKIIFEGEDLTKFREKQWEHIRGDRIATIFQEPMTALNPLIPVGKQILENRILHAPEGETKAQSRAKVLEMMKLVGLPDPERLYKSYPHQLSGGQRQRIMTAIAFINGPDLLIADEPTTALDVTIQAQIMELMKKMNAENHSAVLLISHDLRVVKNMCSRIYIMYAGRVVEAGDTEKILTEPMHPYTKGLLAAIPDASRRGQRLASIPGSVPSIYSRSGEGCGFCGRCPWSLPVCESVEPEMRMEKGRKVWCHRNPDEFTEGGSE